MIRTIFSTTCFFIITLSTSLTAQNDPFKKEINELSKHRQQIRIYIERYQLSTIELAELMSNPAFISNHTKLRSKLLTKAKSKKVAFISNNTLITRPSERAVSESILEYIYPTEYELSTIEIRLENNNQDFKKLPPYRDPFNTTAFETRNLGTTIEIDANVQDDRKTISLRFKPEEVTHIGNVIFAERHIFPTLKPETISLPIFYTVRIDTALNLTDGKFLLAHTASPLKNKELDRSQKILTFIRAEILK